MSLSDLLYDKPEWLILLVLLCLLLLAGEAGHRMGRRRQPSSTDAVRSQVGNIQSALLGLFALLLAFTFAMALIFTILTGGVIGYGNALSGTRAFGTAAILQVLIALFIMAIIDLDRPRRGLIRINLESMINLQKSLDAPK